MHDRNPSSQQDAARPGSGNDRIVVPIDRRLLIAVGCMELGTVVMVTAIILAKGGPMSVLLIVYASIAGSILLIASMRVVVRFEERGLRLSFPPFYWTTVPWSDIADAEPITTDPLRDAGGWGPKWRKGQTWLLAKGGPAVRITRVSGKRPIVFSAPDAEEAALRVMERVVKG